MSKKAFAKLLCLLALAALLAGCAKADPLCGEWAYNHDPDTAVLTLKSSGKARLDGAELTWERCEGGIRLTGEDGSADYRVVEEPECILFYRPALYTRATAGEGLVGVWKSENNWSYEFTGKGTFLEDGVLPGHYFVDEAAGTVRLAYNDPLEDTLLYYTLSGDTLLVDYPWPMVRMD